MPVKRSQNFVRTRPLLRLRKPTKLSLNSLHHQLAPIQLVPFAQEIVRFVHTYTHVSVASVSQSFISLQSAYSFALSMLEVTPSIRSLNSNIRQAQSCPMAVKQWIPLLTAVLNAVGSVGPDLCKMFSRSVPRPDDYNDKMRARDERIQRLEEDYKRFEAEARNREEVARQREEAAYVREKAAFWFCVFVSLFVCFVCLLCLFACLKVLKVLKVCDSEISGTMHSRLCWYLPLENSL